MSEVIQPQTVDERTRNALVLFTSKDGQIVVEATLERENIWLTQAQMADVFQVKRAAITKHLANIFKTKELDKESTCSILEHMGKHRARSYSTAYYNLDAIIAVGYRVNSYRATQFRIWATQILKDYLLKGYALNQRMNRMENTVESLAEKVSEIDLQIKGNNIPMQGVFFDGQVFDAYELTSRIIRSAKKSIVLIDPYMDETTLLHLGKKNQGVKVLLLTKSTTPQLALDVQKANEQYGHFEVKSFSKSHDRFLVIDNREIYHLGASLKDLGKKWFAFSRLDKSSVESLLRNL